MKAKMTGRRPSRANGTKGRFKKGDSKPPGSGRKRGTPNRKSATLKEAYAVAASLVGEKTFNKKTGKYEPGDDDLVGYMLHLARYNEPVFGMLLARALPRPHKPEVKLEPKRHPTEEEVRALCAKHGIPFESPGFPDE